MKFTKAIVHMDLDAFFVSVERLLNPELNGKPVVIGGQSNRGVVSSCSYEARKYGVHSAMPIVKARQLCPDAIFTSSTRGVYAEYSAMVTQIIADRVPLFEKSSIDEFYLDLSGMEKFFGCWKFATELRKTIMQETGLPISFGLSQNKTVSKIATGEAKPNNQMQILPGQEAAFLAPLSIQKIPMVGKRSYERLRQMGFERIADIQKSSPEVLEKYFGKNGLLLWSKAHGRYESKIVAHRERKSVSKERTFGEDTRDTVFLKSVLSGLTEQITYILRKKSFLTSCVAIKIRAKDFETHTFQCKIDYTAADHIIIKQVMQLFEKSYDGSFPVRLIGVRCSDLVKEGWQMHLFNDHEKDKKLYQAIDTIKDRFGTDAINRGRSKQKNS